MADKKKFEKPQMEMIKLNTNIRILAGSCSTYDCWGDGCEPHD